MTLPPEDLIDELRQALDELQSLQEHGDYLESVAADYLLSLSTAALAP